MTDVRGRVAELSLFDGVDRAQLERFLGLIEPESYAPGQVVVAEGDPAEHFGLVIDGAAEVTDGPSRRRIGTAGPGSIIGELGLLRGERRNATVTATSRMQMVLGSLDAFAELLAIDEVRTRLLRQATQHAAGSVETVAAELPDGSPIVLRPILPDDAEAFRATLDRLSPTSRRLRFFTAAPLPPSLIRYLTDLDYRNHFAWVAFADGADDDTGTGIDSGTGIGSARFIRIADRLDVAEIAVEVADEHQRHGVGRLLLGAIAIAAQEAGVERFEGDVLRENDASLRLFTSVGATRISSDDSALRMQVRPADLVAGLDPDVASRLRHVAAELIRLARVAIAPPT